MVKHIHLAQHKSIDKKYISKNYAKKIKKGYQHNVKTLKKSYTQKTTKVELTERFEKSADQKKLEELTWKDVYYVLLGEKSNLQDAMTQFLKNIKL